MHVSELTNDQKQELRQALFWPDEGEEVPEWKNWETFDDVTDEILEREFGHISFVPDDFGSSAYGQCDTIEYKAKQCMDLEDQINSKYGGWRDGWGDYKDITQHLMDCLMRNYKEYDCDFLEFYLNDGDRNGNEVDKKTFEKIFELFFGESFENFLDEHIEKQQEELYERYLERSES